MLSVGVEGFVYIFVFCSLIKQNICILILVFGVRFSVLSGLSG